MHILITGGTGFLGNHVCQLLLQQNHQLTVISRQPQLVFTRYSGRVRALRRLTDLIVSDQFDAVINLSGEGLLDKPWTAQRKLELHTSRVNFTEELVDWMRRVQYKPKVLVSMSASGWYGDQADTILDEDSFYQDSYLHHLCEDWEKAALAADKLGVRVCILRSGVVLGRDGGIIKRLLPVFGLNFGGRIANGKQWVSWIGLHDYLAAVMFLLEHGSAKGIFNLTSPQPVSNADFADKLAHCLHRRAFLQVPSPILRLLMGEMATLVLDSQRCLPSRLLDIGFSFRTPSLAKALAHELQLPDKR